MQDKQNQIQFDIHKCRHQCLPNIMYITKLRDICLRTNIKAKKLHKECQNIPMQKQHKLGNLAKTKT